MKTVSPESIREIYRTTARRFEMILKVYRILGVTLDKWRKRALQQLPKLTRPRILDVGVGTGANLSHLISKYPDYREIVGLDYTHEMLSRAKFRISQNNWNRINLILADAREMSKYISGKFDLIISTYTLSIIPDSPCVLREIRNLLKPSGFLLLLDCQKFKGLLKILNPIAIFLSTRLGGNNETYSVQVSMIASQIFKPVRRFLIYSGLFYEDLYKQRLS
jgi:ubiquinone/menaquinone biosynthesis C-methylase UbiE